MSLIEVRDKFIKYPSWLFLALFVLVSIVLYIFDCNIPIASRDVLVEAHGLVFDLFVFGVVLSFYEYIRSKRDKIERHITEIDAFRTWHEKEASYRILYAIKELNNNGFSEANLSNCYFEKANIQTLIFEKAILEDANFNSAFLNKVNMKNTQSEGAKFIGANISHTDFTDSNLQNTDFSGSNLAWVNLADAILGGPEFVNNSKMRATQVDVITRKPLKEFPSAANFENAILSWVDLRGCNLYGVNFKNVKFNDVKVESVTWFEEVIKLNAQGLENINDTYYIDPEEHKDSSGRRYFWIKTK